MAPKSKTYWRPDAKGHLNAAASLSKNAPHLTKSAPVVQRKLASLRAAAKLANKSKPPAQEQPNLAQPPAGTKPLGTKPATPLQTGQPPRMPTTPS